VRIWLIAVLLATDALTFSVTISRSGNVATLRYPTGAKLALVEVCIETEGYYPNHPDADGWEDTSCHEPRFRIEEHRLRPGAVSLRAHLNISEGGYRSWIHTPVIAVRPRPSQQ
jgi:hypothetical protein